MHTAMQLFAKGWKSVYVPEIFTKGLVPSTLTSYYKQQLKWSRGTLELLVSVYPKLFRKFSWRQRIHFGILPLHYLSGILYLISFLIPIISLFSATTPWKGNVINFGLIFFPLFTFILGIRFYVQRWVTDKSERGTHLIGGVLLACTWWIYIIGFFYTIIRKNISYLPTPKEDTDLTSWKILIPNFLVGIVSVIAVIYGLSIDFTPFSMFMSGFALLNAFFMFYTLIFAYRNQKKVVPRFDSKSKENSFIDRLQNYAYGFWHKAALPLVVIILVIVGRFHYQTEYVKWRGVKSDIQNKNVINYIGVFAPQIDNGISNLQNVKKVSNQINEKFDIVSIYIAWEKNIESNFPNLMLDSIYSQKSIPAITWEPWLTSFGDELNGKHVFDLIIEGYFDNYIEDFAKKLKKVQRPIFFRFAHEFDNPFYPWHLKGNDAAVKFKKAWIHTYEIFKNNDAVNVIWVWNPWKSANIASYYPGKEYVDWIGVNILNYGNLNKDEIWHDFKSLYEPFHIEIENLPSAPVVISEFGSLKKEQRQDEWLKDAFVSIQNDFNEIKSVIYFNSKVDNNWPNGLRQNENLDWTIAENQVIKNSFSSKEVPGYVFSPFPVINSTKKEEPSLKTQTLKNIKGINLKIGHNWRKDYHVLSRKNILTDFEKIKRLGINTVKFDGNTIYSYNLLKVSKEIDLNVSIGYWIPAYLDFVEDTLETEKLKQSILQKITRQQHYSHITSWNIQNDVQYNQKDFFLKPRLFYQNKAYIIWLKELVEEIKKIDSVRPIYVELEVNQLSNYHSKILIDNVNGFDGLGLVVKDDKYLKSLIQNLNLSKIDYVCSEIDVQTLIQPDIFNIHPSFFITSWQDKHESNKLTFDGITDWKGRYKTDYFKLLNALQKSNINSTDPKIRILKPAIPIYDNNVLDYYAMCYNNNNNEGWQNGEMITDLKFEWSLIKCDSYGNYLAIRDVGVGATLSLKIPPNHEYFRLLLTAINGNSVTTTITALNTPLLQKVESLNQ